MDGEPRDTDVVDQRKNFDPDEPTPAVGSLPSLDPRRLGMPALAWLFVAGAAFVVVRSSAMYAGIPLEIGQVLNAVFGTLVGVLVLLVPAALLRRVPDAPRRLPLLFTGLSLEVLLWLLSPYGAPWAAEGDPFATILPLVGQALGAAGPLFVGLGLLRLRARRPDRFLLLAAMALVYGAGVVAQQAAYFGLAAVWPDTQAVVANVLYVLPSAFALWVPVAAWLDRDTPRRFWALLAAAFPLWVVVLGLGVAANLATREQFGAGMAELGWAVFAFLWAAPSLLAFIAYGWLIPKPAAVDQAPMDAVVPLAPA